MGSYPVSDHFDGERFVNPHAVAGRNVGEVVRWARTRQRTPWPASVPLVPQPAAPSRVGAGQVAVTFIGHSTFLIRTASAVWITDPVFTSHAGPFGRLGPRRVRPPAIALADLPPVDVVLLSHNHYDHLQPSSLAALGDASIVTTLGVGRYLPPEGGNHKRASGRHLPPEGGNHKSSERSPVASASTHASPVASAFRRNVTELDWWHETRIGDATITAVPAQHFSARTPWDRNTSLWCGFVVEVDGVTIYFAGDSGYSPQFAEIGARFPRIDVALIPIGAYEPRWFMQPMHMNPDEAVRAHLDVRARVSIGMHFGTFQLTDEGIDEPLAALARARDAYGVSADAFSALDFGATRIAGDNEVRRRTQEERR